MTRISPGEWAKRVEQLEDAARRAMPAPTVLIKNDPEDPALLELCRLGLNDTRQTIDIGPPRFPGPEWYSAYQDAAKSGDSEYARALLRDGAKALRSISGPPADDV
jgi:hypothetical protein